jgi:hypothetical protein
VDIVRFGRAYQACDMCAQRLGEDFKRVVFRPSGLEWRLCPQCYEDWLAGSFEEPGD